ncbi:putative TatD-related deoxyribonuclease [Mycoplasma mycoides subsp. mycoides KH3J]|nr:putativeTatD-related deoxyribonuclease [Mycoplasma mycoides subsp. mycoides B345/93]PTD32701.1 putative TatD-related deoxyribonuclease [Mycoplasma mycoides subsp. mycoides C425/93]PTD33142.1 putative TatD-related deoxyribonuclease [Mycoplasma mycoides subsp. mycoides KH3J]PTD33311.1 putative TatD-related deoxyribonuclease [Mycoplasma mycoides subsp. mycoides str. Gemu Goffa]
MNISGLYDTHCHLNDNRFIDIDMTSNEIVFEAKRSGVKYINNIGYDVKTSKTAIFQANLSPNVFAVVGIHPSQIHLYSEQAFQIIEELANSNKVVGIGEIGLDFFETNKYEKQQILGFEKQIDIAKKLDLPVVVHLRDATNHFRVFEIAYKIFKEKRVTKAVIHGFRGPLEWALKFIDLGFYISFDAAITHEVELEQVVKNVSLNRLLVETNSPFLPPSPYKKGLSYPKYLPLIVKHIAKIKEVSDSIVAENTKKQRWKIIFKIILKKREFKFLVFYSTRSSKFNTLSAQLVSKLISWVVIKTVPWNSLIASSKDSFAKTSIWLVGSSKINKLAGSKLSEANLTLVCSPPDKSLIGFNISSDFIPNLESVALISGSKTSLCLLDKYEIGVSYSWNFSTCSKYLTSTPSPSLHQPLIGFNWFEIVFKKVVFPIPLYPLTIHFWPSLNSKVKGAVKLKL